MARRLTKEEKGNILHGYCAGETTIDLSKKYNCSQNTVVRIVKSLLPAEQYNNLKKSRSKDNLGLETKKSEDFTEDNLISLNKLKENNTYAEAEIKSSFKHFKSDINQQETFQSPLTLSSLDVPVELDPKLNKHLIQEDNNDLDQLGVFTELEPLASSFDLNPEQQKVSCTSLSDHVLPEVVYMLIDKKVELESKPLGDFPEWSFIPELDKERLAIHLFSNQRSAKRNCARNQRVIKIPDTSVFKISAPYLISKGITRLVLEDELIALDN